MPRWCGRCLAERWYTAPPRDRRLRWLLAVDLRTALEEQFAQHGAVAMGFIGAIASDREIGLMRQRRQQIERMPRARRGHFAPVLSCESAPVPCGSCGQRPLEQFLAWRQRRQPHIVKILRGVLGLENAPRRTSYGADAQAFPRQAVGSQTDDANSHRDRLADDWRARLKSGQHQIAGEHGSDRSHSHVDGRAQPRPRTGRHVLRRQLENETAEREA